jgi:hypothetical protein
MLTMSSWKEAPKDRADKKPCCLIYVDTPIGVCFTTLTIKGCGYPVGKVEQLCGVITHSIRIRHAFG